MTPCRLIYRSTINPDLIDDRALEVLENRALTNNRRLGVCGLLLLSGNQFLQVLEGTSKFVNEIYNNIVQDKRHHEVCLISYEGIVKPEFIEWDMKVVNLNALDEQLNKLFREKYPVVNDCIVFNNDALLMMALLIDMRHALNQSK